MEMDKIKSVHKLSGSGKELYSIYLEIDFN